MSKFFLLKSTLYYFPYTDENYQQKYLDTASLKQQIVIKFKSTNIFYTIFKNFGYQYDLIFPPFLITAVLFMNVIILVFQTTFGQMVTIPYTLFGFPLLTMFLGLYFKLQAMACERGSQPENRINIKLQSSAISCDISI